MYGTITNKELTALYEYEFLAVAVSVFKLQNGFRAFPSIYIWTLDLLWGKSNVFQNVYFRKSAVECVYFLLL